MTRNRKLPLPAVLLIAGGATHRLAETFYDLAMPLLILKITGSPYMMATMFAAGYLAEFVVAVIGGSAVDRVSRRKLLVAISLAECALLVVAAYLSYEDALPGWGVIAVAACFDFAVQLYFVADTAALPNVVDRELLPKANGIFQVALSSAQAAGPLLAGLAIYLANVSVTLALTALLLMPLAIFVARVRWPASEPHEVETGILRHMWDGLAFTFANPLFRVLILWRGLFDFAFGASYLMTVYYMREALHLPTWQIGAATAIMAIGGIVGGSCFAFLQARVASNLIITGATMLVAASLVALCFARHWLVIGADLSILLICMSIMNRLTSLLFQDKVPDAYLGRVLASSDILTTVLGPVSVLGAAVVASTVGVRWVFGLSAIAIAVLAALSRRGVMATADWGIRHVDRSDSEEPEMGDATIV
jgi:MFS family permease